MPIQDLVHLLWRHRRQLLDDKKTLHFNGYIACRAHLKDVPWLTATMLDFSNKQDWLAVEAIFSMRTCNFLEEKIVNGEHQRRGTYLYCVMGMLLLNAWFAEANDDPTNRWEPGQSVEDAACVLAHVVIWRNAVAKDPQLKLKNDCMTRETILDTYTSCSTCIYRFPLYRDHYPEHKPYGPNFCQSRFSEYGFQRCRMKESINSPSLPVKGFYVAFGHTLFQISLEATSLLRIPDSRRGVPHSIGRVQPDPPSPAYRHATQDPQLKERMLAGFKKAQWLWKEVVGYDVDVSLPGFFEDPWKHFDLTAELTFNTTNGKEDGEEEEVVLNSQDADDAAELMGRLIEGLADRLGGAAITPSSEQLAIQQAMGGLFREFNSRLSEESYMRKHRFRTNTLLKADGKSSSLLTEECTVIAIFV